MIAVCTACHTIQNYKHDPRLPRSTKTFLHPVALCLACGHLMLNVNGVNRNLTPAEKLKLPSHELANRIQEAQSRVTHWMVG